MDGVMKDKDKMFTYMERLCNSLKSIMTNMEGNVKEMEGAITFRESLLTDEERNVTVRNFGKVFLIKNFFLNKRLTIQMS